MKEIWVLPLGGKDPLEKEMATHFSILVWKIPWMRGAWQVIVRGVAKSRKWLSMPATVSLGSDDYLFLAPWRDRLSCLYTSSKKKKSFLLVFSPKIALNPTFPHHFMHVTEVNSPSLNEEVLEIQMCTLLSKKSSLHTFSKYSFDSWCKKLSPHFWTFLLMSPSSMCYQPQTPPPPRCLTLVAKVDVYTWSEGASNFASFCTEAAGTY